jgi:putative acetyltransferase
MNFSTKPMTIAEFNAVMQLWQATEGVGLSESDSLENITSYLERNPGLSRVAFDGLNLIGAVLCGHDGRRGYLHHLAVAASHRKQGLGKQLVAECLAGLTRLGIPKCNIFLFTDNVAGGAFWQHNGWVKRADLQVLQIPCPADSP